jgi:hypothetical protein
MKKWLVVASVAAFVAFAWLMLPSPDQAQRSGALLTASGSGLVQHVYREQTR